ncbi:MAG TPA: TonB family protein [Candidatus Sulfotelmatobacter sp.]|nr:TonB family protein [Candidatus Sulfotelmatobacter sp.]
MMHNGPVRSTVPNQQPRRLVLALALLLIALIALLIKDRQFWFGTEQATIDSDVPEATLATQATNARPAQPAAAAATKKASHPVKAATAAQPAETPGVAVTRTILPPLDVDVVAGDKHHKVHPGSNQTHVEIPAAQGAFAPATNAAERQALPKAQEVPASASYPLLAQHMNVQGSVVLQALISAQGSVENLTVLSGPAILTTAAQQAVREWRFKPVMQNGQAVETKAMITVNFSIKVADNSANTTLAETRASEILIVSR